MLDRANRLMIAAYISLTGRARSFAKELKSDERGLSGVVVAVLLILVAVLAVVLLWGLLKDWLQNVLWPKITGSAQFE